MWEQAGAWSGSRWCRRNEAERDGKRGRPTKTDARNGRLRWPGLLRGGLKETQRQREIARETETERDTPTNMGTQREAQRQRLRERRPRKGRLRACDTGTGDPVRQRGTVLQRQGYLCVHYPDRCLERQTQKSWDPRERQRHRDMKPRERQTWSNRDGEREIYLIHRSKNKEAAKTRKQTNTY